MILTPENTSRVSRPVNVFDAAGIPVQHCVRADTETGEVICMIKVNGQFVLNDARNGVKTVTEFRPAPLRVEPITIPTSKEGVSNDMDL
jgi:hypothetical protein